MYELVQAAGCSYYIESPARIGLVQVGANEACLIDSGNDKDAGRRIKKILEIQGWKLCAIYNTHSHADHIGGNKYLQAQTGCKIYAPGIDAAFARHTVLEPAFLYGACPPKELRHKFLMAQESGTEYLAQEVLPPGWEIIRLPGHCFAMVGFRTPDDVVYLADCLFSRATLEKYQIGFLYDVAAYLKSLKLVKTLKAKFFVPAHAAVTENITELAQYNIDKVQETAEKILALCAEPLCMEALLKKLADAYSLTLNFEQYVLVGSTIRSYLAWLKDTGRMNAEFADNMLLWRRA